jgi:hypothetical protein
LKRDCEETGEISSISSPSEKNHEESGKVSSISFRSENCEEAGDGSLIFDQSEKNFFDFWSRRRERPSVFDSRSIFCLAGDHLRGIADVERHQLHTAGELFIYRGVNNPKSIIRNRRVFGYYRGNIAGTSTGGKANGKSM